MVIKQSSTARALVFLMLDSTDHITGKTGLSPTVTLSKNGGSFASPSGSVTEISAGWYKVAGNATDTGTLGALALHATGSGADPCDMLFEVVAVDVDDAVRLGLTALPNAAAEAAGGLYTRGTGAGQINQAANGQVDANTVKVSGTTQTGRDLGASVLLSVGTGTGQVNLTSGKVPATIAAGDLATDSVTGASVKADAVTKIQAGLSTYAGGAVASVTGNVGGNVVGSVASVTAPVSLTGDLTATMKTSVTTAATAATPTAAAVTADVGITQGGADKVWGTAARSLTTFGTLVADIWANGTRSLTTFGTLVADVATAVWAAATRTLTAISDSAGVTTLLNRIPSALTITGGKVDVNTLPDPAPAGYGGTFEGDISGLTEEQAQELEDIATAIAAAQSILLANLYVPVVPIAVEISPVEAEPTGPVTSHLSVVAKLRWVPKLPEEKMTLRNFEGLRLMVNSILMEKSGNGDGAQAFEQKALNEMEKELRDYLSGIKHVVSFEDDQDVAVTRMGSML